MLDWILSNLLFGQVDSALLIIRFVVVAQVIVSRRGYLIDRTLRMGVRIIRLSVIFPFFCNFISKYWNTCIFMVSCSHEIPRLKPMEKILSMWTYPLVTLKICKNWSLTILIDLKLQGLLKYENVQISLSSSLEKTRNEDFHINRILITFSIIHVDV